MSHSLSTADKNYNFPAITNSVVTILIYPNTQNTSNTDETDVTTPVTSTLATFTPVKTLQQANAWNSKSYGHSTLTKSNSWLSLSINHGVSLWLPILYLGVNMIYNWSAKKSTRAYPCSRNLTLNTLTLKLIQDILCFDVLTLKWYPNLKYLKSIL